MGCCAGKQDASEPTKAMKQNQIMNAKGTEKGNQMVIVDGGMSITGSNKLKDATTPPVGLSPGSEFGFAQLSMQTPQFQGESSPISNVLQNSNADNQSPNFQKTRKVMSDPRGPESLKNISKNGSDPKAMQSHPAANMSISESEFKPHNHTFAMHHKSFEPSFVKSDEHKDEIQNSNILDNDGNPIVPINHMTPEASANPFISQTVEDLSRQDSIPFRPGQPMENILISDQNMTFSEQQNFNPNVSFGKRDGMADNPIGKSEFGRSASVVDKQSQGRNQQPSENRAVTNDLSRGMVRGGDWLKIVNVNPNTTAQFNEPLRQESLQDEVHTRKKTNFESGELVMGDKQKDNKTQAEKVKTVTIQVMSKDFGQFYLPLSDLEREINKAYPGVFVNVSSTQANVSSVSIQGKDTIGTFKTIPELHAILGKKGELLQKYLK